MNFSSKLERNARTGKAQSNKIATDREDRGLIVATIIVLSPRHNIQAGYNSQIHLGLCPMKSGDLPQR
jgi:hypothetical protein